MPDQQHLNLQKKKTKRLEFNIFVSYFYTINPALLQATKTSTAMKLQLLFKLKKLI